MRHRRTTDFLSCEMLDTCASPRIYFYTNSRQTLHEMLDTCASPLLISTQILDEYTKCLAHVPRGDPAVVSVEIHVSSDPPPTRQPRRQWVYEVWGHTVSRLLWEMLFMASFGKSGTLKPPCQAGGSPKKAMPVPSKHTHSCTYPCASPFSRHTPWDRQRVPAMSKSRDPAVASACKATLDAQPSGITMSGTIPAALPR